MSKISLVLAADRIIVGCEVKSKKKALETISQLLTTQQIDDDIDVHTLLGAFFEREKLGSMAVGHGVALPHIRLETVKQPIAALLILEQPIIYDDQAHPVDIVFGLLLPKSDDQATNQDNLDLLQHLASYLKQPQVREQMRQADDSAHLYDLLCRLT